MTKAQTTLTTIEQKTDKLDGIKIAIKDINRTLKIGVTVISVCVAISWFIFGS